MSTRARIKAAGFTVGLVLTLILVIQNLESADTDVLLWSFAMPRAVLLLVTFLIGMAVGALGVHLSARRRW